MGMPEMWTKDELIVVGCIVGACVLVGVGITLAGVVTVKWWLTK